MRMINKVLIGTITIILAVIIVTYIIGILASPGKEPLRFTIINEDTNNHIVTVEILDSSNKSLFNETYVAIPKEIINSPEIANKMGRYNFRVILDDKIENTLTAEVARGKSRVTIRLYENVTGQIIPIHIGQAIV